MIALLLLKTDFWKLFTSLPRSYLKVWPLASAMSSVLGLSLEERVQRVGRVGRHVSIQVVTICSCVSCWLPDSQHPSLSDPQPVSSLFMLPLNDGRALKVSWSPPRGHWENYHVLLRNGSEVLVNQTINKLSTQLTFSVLGLGLVPGHLYEAEVTVHSGILGNTVRCYGRLGQLNLHFCYSNCCQRKAKLGLS